MPAVTGVFNKPAGLSDGCTPTGVLGFAGVVVFSTGTADSVVFATGAAGSVVFSTGAVSSVVFATGAAGVGTGFLVVYIGLELMVNGRYIETQLPQERWME